MRASKLVSTAIEILGLAAVVTGVAMLAGVAWSLITAGILAVVYSVALDR